MRKRAVLFANSGWYLYNYRLTLAGALRQNGYEVILLSPAGRYSQRLLNAGHVWREVPLDRRGLNPFAEILTLLRLLRLYRDVHPELVHHFTIKCIIYGSIAAKMIGISKIINAVTGLGYVFVDYSLASYFLRESVMGLYRIALKNTKVVFQNPDDQDLFLAKKVVQDSQIVLIKGSGLDVDYFTPTDENDETPLVVLASRLLWHKGILEFVEAARMLKDARLNARFALVGDIDAGNPASVSQENLNEWMEREIIEWWGWQDDMRSVYRQAHLICLPTYYREGLPRGLLEAGASGRAVIATDVPGCREVVHQDVNGLLIPAKDSEALAQAMKKLIEDPKLRRKMGKRGREIVLNEFSQEKILDQTLAVYNSF